MKIVFWIVCMVLLLQDLESQDKAMGIVRNAKEKRVALVIGNAAYTSDALQNTINDAEDMTKMLRGFGFEVDLRKDCNQEEMEDAIERFVEKLDKESVGLLYYSGHGAQIGGENYLIPINHSIRRDIEIKRKAVSANTLLEMMEQKETMLNIIILDACRNNPFGTGKSFRISSKSGFKQGLAEMKAKGSIVVYATGAGETASDNPDERNGLFTKYLLKYMPSGKSLLDMLTDVNNDVYNASNKKQCPFQYTGLRKSFYFSTPSLPAPDPTPGPDPNPFNMEDLKKWNKNLKEMKAAFEEIKTSGMESGIKKMAWERFCNSFSQNNPYSQEDESMRDEAQKGIAECEREMSKKRLEFEIKEVKTQDSNKQAKSTFEAGETVYVSLTWLVKSLEGGEKESVEIQGEGIPLYSRTIREQSKEGEWTIPLPLSLQSAGNYRANVSLKIGLMQKQSSVWFEIKAKPQPPQAQYKTSQDGRYWVLSSGIIQDTKTNLEWLVGPDQDTNWYEAKAWVESISASQHGTGWRMPTRQELPTIYEKGKGSCNIDTVFVSPRKYLWVWSGELNGSSSAWVFLFRVGTVGWHAVSIRTDRRVFAVRSGKQ